MSSEFWYVYILQCDDGSYYTGITPNINQRLRKHNASKGCRYTRARTPVELVFQERHPNKSIARKREIEIKDYSRQKKENLIRTNKVRDFSRAVPSR